MAEQTRDRRSGRTAAFIRELPGGAVLGVAFVLFAWLSWRTWPDVLVDFGQELYIPWRLSTGEVLYRDLAWVTGPLSQYVNALLFRVFGASLSTLIFANLTLLLVIVAMLYGIFRRCGTLWSATYCGFFFLAVFAFRQYSLIGNYNYICPYRHDVTHGLALGLMALLCLIQFGSTGHKRWLISVGVCIGLIVLAKIEMALAAGLTIAAALPLFAWQKRSQGAAGGTSPLPPSTSRFVSWIGKTVSWAGIVAASALVPIIAVVGALAAPLGWSSSFRHVFLQYQLALEPETSTGSAYYRAISGTDLPAENLVDMAFAAVVVLAGIVAGLVMEMIFGRSRYAVWWATALGLIVGYAGLAFVPLDEWETLPACVPLLLAPVIMYSLRQAIRGQNAGGPATVLFLTAIYGISLLPKVLLRTRWSHYGFVLAAPGTLVLIHVAQHSIPAWWLERRRSGRCFVAVATGLLTACALSLVLGWSRIDMVKSAVVGEGGDRFFVDPIHDGRAVPMMRTLEYLREHRRPEETLAVFPNGVMLNYLLRARNPTAFINVSPCSWECDVHGGDEFIADTVIRAAPDYAVIVTMDLSIHGRGNFGDPQFGAKIRKFLDEHYDVVDEHTSAGGLGGGFVSTIFKRRPM